MTTALIIAIAVLLILYRRERRRNLRLRIRLERRQLGQLNGLANLMWSVRPRHNTGYPTEPAITE